MAIRHGLHATFMPKPVEGLAVSGMHVNCSLLTMDDKKAFYDPNTKNQLSEVAEKWISGIIHHAKGFCLITNPMVNSYKRIVPGYDAPCYITWSNANRSTMIRIPAARGDKTRTEERSVDGSANPYLAIAAILAAGLDGVEGNVSLVSPVDENLFDLDDEGRKALCVESLPSDLNEAIKEFKKDTLIQEAMGSHTVKKLLEAKTIEWNAYHKFVTNWEINRYINKY
jgi:glutamine synthetase